MHNGPQISRKGEWGDASIVENNRGKIDYYCRYCRFKCRSLSTIIDHVNLCKEIILEKIENIDYVACKICNLHGQSIGVHITAIHPEISLEDYKVKYGQIICDNLSKIVANNNSVRPHWLIKAKQEGKDLSNYKQKLSKAISKAILSNPKELERRANLLKNLWDSNFKHNEEYIKNLSERAKIISFRPDILEKRSEVLRKWRKENPEKFKNICTDAMIKAKISKEYAYVSKPELILLDFLLKNTNFKFKSSQFLSSDTFISKSKRKQIDIADKEKNIYIEYDGPVHFKPIYGQENFELCQKSDKLLEKYILNNNYILIRISYDHCFYRSKIYFSQESLDFICNVLNKNVPGVYKIGKFYDKY